MNWTVYTRGTEYMTFKKMVKRASLLTDSCMDGDRLLPQNDIFIVKKMKFN